MNTFCDLPDHKLTRAIKASNVTAFEALYFRYYGSLYRFMWHRTYSVETTKDFIQEIFTRLWQNRRNLDTKKSIKAYLYQIANHLVIDHLRKTTSKRSYLSDLARKDRDSQDSDVEAQTSVAIALGKLPEKLRTVFILSRYEGLQYTEIAEVCGISVKTVESWMSQALRLLREELL